MKRAVRHYTGRLNSLQGEIKKRAKRAIEKTKAPPL
nr:MAG TPA: hypothetical protein [Caudoviricetes sp.]